jgi:energy-coupling factor transport system substrate-specific component
MCLPRFTSILVLLFLEPKHYILIGGILAEIVSDMGGHKRFTLSVAAYAVFGLGCNFGVFGMILLARDYWYAYAVGTGMSEERLKQTMAIVSWPLMGISSAAVIATAVLGMLFGRFMLKKHFQRAGIL